METGYGEQTEKKKWSDYDLAIWALGFFSGFLTGMIALAIIYTVIYS